MNKERICLAVEYAEIDFIRETDKVANKIIGTLKEECLDYGELLKNLDYFKKNIKHTEKEKFNFLIFRIEVIIAEEVNGLRLTNHP